MSEKTSVAFAAHSGLLSGFVAAFVAVVRGFAAVVVVVVAAIAAVPTKMRHRLPSF